MAELADAVDLKSPELRVRTGSIPVSDIKTYKQPGFQAHIVEVYWQ